MTRCLPRFPRVGTSVASRQSLRKAKLIRKTWMGEEIVAWSDEVGRVCVAEAYCVHLGSDLGPAAGGRIRAGRLVCPFHGYEYDASGQCVATPYADPPRTAKLRVFETQEIAGLIFAWWGIGGREPQWSLHPDFVAQAAAGATTQLRPSAFPAIRRTQRRTLWTWPTFATSMATATWTAASQW